MPTQRGISIFITRIIGGEAEIYTPFISGFREYNSGDKHIRIMGGWARNADRFYNWEETGGRVFLWNDVKAPFAAYDFS